MSKFNAFVFVALCLVAVGAQNVTYTIPLTPAANDTLTFQRVARSNLFNMLQVIRGLIVLWTQQVDAGCCDPVR